MLQILDSQLCEFPSAIREVCEVYTCVYFLFPFSLPVKPWQFWLSVT